MTQTLLPPTAGLYVQDAEQPLAFPLKHTEVKAQVSGHLARVEVIQTFENPFATPLEAIYIFPLPDEAAVDSMVIRLGDRAIRGRIEKREQAQAIYDQAKKQGQTAGLLEQERANIFTQSLANILPGEQIEVVIGYSDQLAYKQGAYEFVFPMVVGPRYIPGTSIAGPGSRPGSAPEPMTLNQDTDIVPDASRLNAPILPADLRSGHDIQVTVDIATGAGPWKLESANFQSPSHQIAINSQDAITRVTLAPNDTLPNKDFILRYQVAGAATQTSVLTQSDERGGHFAAYLIPAIHYDSAQYIPKDMVFLIDTSGSQSGPPLDQCKALMHRFIQGLHPQDTFNIVNFANTTQQLAKVPLENTPQNRQRALTYVDRLQAGGGTEMLQGFKTVLNLPQMDRERIRNIVLLTDGYIGNETQIFAEAQRSLTLSTRIHSFGAGSSVNRFLLNRVAEMGRGISHVVRHDEAIERVVDKFLEQINNPVLGNLSLRWEGPGEAPDLYPIAPPDLFAEQPLVLLGRKRDRQPGTLRVTGMAASGDSFESFALHFEPSGNPALAQLWGRARIKALMNQMVSGETTVGVAAVTETALAYQLLSQYTAFVAISDEVRVEQPNESVSVNVPVNMPEAVSHTKVFRKRAVAPVPCMAAEEQASLMEAEEDSFESEMPPLSPSTSSWGVVGSSDAFSGPTSQLGTSPEAPSEPTEKALRPQPKAGRSAPQSPAPRKIGRSQSEVSRSEPRSRPGMRLKKATRFSGHGEPTEKRGEAQKKSKPVRQSIFLRIKDWFSALFNLNSLKTGQPSTPQSQIQIVKAEGLNPDLLQQLQQNLESHWLSITPQPKGTLVFELVIQHGRVKRVMLDVEASDPQDPAAVERIRQIFFQWLCPQDFVEPLRVELRV